MKKILSSSITFCFFWYILVSPVSMLSAQDSQKLTIAVLSIQSKGGVTDNEAATLADRLRSALVNLERFSVVERGQMNAILEEQGFSQSGCVSSECAIEAGRLLGVRLMATGDVGKIGDVFTIDVRVFDVTTGKIIRAIEKNYQGNVAGLLDVMKTVANELAGKKEEVKSSSGFPLWLKATLGVVVIGGTVALLAGGGDKKEDDSKLPVPNWPPSN